MPVQSRYAKSTLNSLLGHSIVATNLQPLLIRRIARYAESAKLLSIAMRIHSRLPETLGTHVMSEASFDTLPTETER